MSEYVRRLVSGNKARFKDEILKLELDLVYLTDNIIIMGYPASGLEGYYRNKKEDVKKFLDHRHGKNYWIFNFCPLKENSYDAGYFGGRVSRYPFPDHHAPPLAIMPLVAREMRAWLKGSQDRVVVLHCKAGKGRSGTMACTYLLSLHEASTPLELQRSLKVKEWAEQCAEKTMDILPANEELDEMQETKSPLLEVKASRLTRHSDDIASPHPTSPVSERAFTEALKGVLDLHTAQRMKAPSSSKKKAKHGVSIPSQRRYLHYWALLLAHSASNGFWSFDPSSFRTPTLTLSRPSETNKKHVRLTKIKLRLQELSRVKINLVKAANLVIDKTKGPSFVPKPKTSDGKEQSMTSKANPLWVSLAKYDDKFVSALETWEKYTRSIEGMGIRRSGSECMTNEGGREEMVSDFFSNGKWDKKKMVSSFARLAETMEPPQNSNEGLDKDKKIITHTLYPITAKGWDGIKHDVRSKNDAKMEEDKQQAQERDLSADEINSISDVNPNNDSSMTFHQENEQGIILDAEREVRIKLYMGQVFMGWIWLIPTFHIASPPTTLNDAANPITVRFSLEDIDFPIGIGASIVDVEVLFQWVLPTESRTTAANVNVTSQQPQDHGGSPPSELPSSGVSGEEPMGLAGTLNVALGGTSAGTSLGGESHTVRNIIEMKQAE